MINYFNIKTKYVKYLKTQKHGKQHTKSLKQYELDINCKKTYDKFYNYVLCQISKVAQIEKITHIMLCTSHCNLEQMSN